MTAAEALHVDTSAPSWDTALIMAIHGGVRENAGRIAAYPNKTNMEPMDMTAAGRERLRDLVDRSGLSISDVMNHLALTKGRTLRNDPRMKHDGVLFPNKVGRHTDTGSGKPICARFDDKAKAILDRVKETTGKSMSDIGEALVVWHGSTAVFPTKEGKDKRRARPKAKKK